MQTRTYPYIGEFTRGHYVRVRFTSPGTGRIEAVEGRSGPDYEIGSKRVDWNEAMFKPYTPPYLRVSENLTLRQVYHDVLPL